MKNDTKLLFYLSFCTRYNIIIYLNLSDYTLSLLALTDKCNIISKSYLLEHNYYLVHERTFNFDNDILKLPRGVYLEGYWQSPKYFPEVECEIRESFKFKSLGSGVYDEIEKDIIRNNSVCLYVRRGDMASNPSIAKFHG